MHPSSFDNNIVWISLYMQSNVFATMVLVIHVGNHIFWFDIYEVWAFDSAARWIGGRPNEQKKNPLNLRAHTRSKKNVGSLCGGPAAWNSQRIDWHIGHRSFIKCHTIYIYRLRYSAETTGRPTELRIEVSMVYSESEILFIFATAFDMVCWLEIIIIINNNSLLVRPHSIFADKSQRQNQKWVIIIILNIYDWNKWSASVFSVGIMLWQKCIVALHRQGSDIQLIWNLYICKQWISTHTHTRDLECCNTMDASFNWYLLRILTMLWQTTIRKSQMACIMSWTQCLALTREAHSKRESTVDAHLYVMHGYKRIICKHFREPYPWHPCGAHMSINREQNLC